MDRTNTKTVRKQYHSRQVGSDRHVWDVHRLMRAARDIEVQTVPVSDIAETDENWWYGDANAVPTPRSIASHVALINEVDPLHPVILCAEGRLMDGMHRVVKAIAEGRTHVPAVRFSRTPDPDFVNVALDELPYPDEVV
ncbi:hypothetical protein M2324_004013 [Rhodovulum sulfidophilum]|uniref:hypothetical protein n=2 Tax=Rhodovulum sulfidophilum TaxID=35806 RepID=UPI0005A63B27|nr:hypothetical protein [Rhodovulum sulfidophilum]MCW2305586.1 hypothetical protein [Rhodovulum sulfidophilum]